MIQRSTFMVETSTKRSSSINKDERRDRWQRFSRHKRRQPPSVPSTVREQQRKELAAQRGQVRHAEREHYLAILARNALSGAVRQRLVPSQALSAAKRVRKRKDSLASPRQVPSTMCRPLERTGAPERPPKAPGHQIMVQKRVRVRQHRTPADLAVILEHDRVATTNHIEDEVRLQTGSYPARATLPETLGGDTSAAVPSAAGDDLSQAMNASQTGQGHECVGPSTTTGVRSASLNDPRWVSSPGEAAKLQGPQRTLVGVSMQSQTVSKRCEGETATSCATALSGPRLDDAASLGRTPPSTQTGQVTIPATFSGPESNTYRDTIDATSGMTRRSLLTRATTSKSFFVTVHRPQSVVEQRAALPVFEMEQEFMEKLHDHGVVIVVGPTGSGKTTQIPQFLYEAGYGHPDRSRRPGGPVVVVQPRRLAAIWCAERVAAELGAEESQNPSVAETRSLECPIRLGVQVGYHVRHQRRANDEQTRILFVTDGVLLRELASDVTLRRYGCVILDEVHERSIQMDLLLGLLSRTVRLRRSLAWQRAYPQIGPLRLVIMSATIDAETLAHHPQLFNPDEPWIESVSTGHVPEPGSVTDAGQVPHPDAELEVSPSASSPQPEQCRASTQVHRSAHVVTPSTTSSNEACIDTSGAPTMVSSDGLATPARAASPVGFMKTKATEWKWHRPAVLTIPGRQYPVSVHFARRTHCDYLEAAREKCLKIHQRLPPGHILVFMPGRRAIAQLCSALQQTWQHNTEHPLQVLALYAGIPQSAQEAILRAAQGVERVCIVATNVAESAVTIPNVRYVVDSGRVRRVVVHNRGSQAISLHQVTWTSQASASQRAGRAGRTGPGHCYRLYSAATFGNLFPPADEPEIQRLPLESVLLFLSRLGIRWPLKFPWVTRPDPNALKRAIWVLTVLGAIEPSDERACGQTSASTLRCSPTLDSNQGTGTVQQARPSLAREREALLGALTPLGAAMARLPVSARLARLLLWLQTTDPSCLPYGIRLVALLSVRDIVQHSVWQEITGDDHHDALDRRRRQQFLAHPDSEVLTKLRLLGAAEHVWCTGDDSSAFSKFCAAYGLIETTVREALLIVRQLEQLGLQHLGTKTLSFRVAVETAAVGDTVVRSDASHLPPGFDESASLEEQSSWSDHTEDEDHDPAWFASSREAPSTFMTRTPPLPPPSLEQERELCRALLAAFPDQVARRMEPDQAYQWRQEHPQTSGGILFRCPVWDADEHPTKMPFIARVSRYCPVDPSRDTARYLLYTELTVEDPEQAEVTGKSPTVATMRGVTRIEPHWLATMGRPPLVRYGEVVGELAPPRYDAQTDQVMAWIRTFYSREAWPLPVRWMPLPSVIQESPTRLIDQRERRLCLFARALLERQVLASFPPMECCGRLRPSPAVLTWDTDLEHSSGSAARVPAYRQHRAAVLWLAALRRHRVERRCTLLEQWQRDPQFLLDEFLLWVPASDQEVLQKNWTSMTAVICRSSSETRERA